MAEKHNLVCIVCPVGCRLTVEKDNQGKLKVQGNKCKRGKEYGLKELTNPTRVLPTTVRIAEGTLNRLPVRTNKPMPKELISDAMKVINTISVKAPVNMGDIIIENLLNTGVDLVASRSISRI